MKDPVLIEKLKLRSNEHELLMALLKIAEEDWEAAHNIAQNREGEWQYDRIHALLHRIEGDDFNARYWYRRVNEAFPTKSIDEEWDELATQYLSGKYTVTS